MATGNFHSKSGKYYAICMGTTEPELDDDGNETGNEVVRYADEDDYEETIKSIQEAFEEFTKNNSFEFNKRKESIDRDGRLFGTIGISKDYAGIGVELNYNLIVRSGYYEGANLDYEYEFIIDGNKFEDITDCEFSFMESLDFSNGHFNKPTGFARIQSKHAMTWLTRMFAELDEAVNKLLRENSIELIVKAHFSNGEIWYQQKGE